MTAQLRNPQYSALLQRASELCRSGSLCDTVVMVDGQDFRAHSLVLACASRELERQLTIAKKGHDDQNRRSCSIDMLSARTFQQVLDYTYGDVLEVPVDDLQGLLKAARVLEMEELGKQCLVWLKMVDRGPGGGNRGDRSSGTIREEPESAEASPGSADLEVMDSPSYDSPLSRESEPDDLPRTLRRVSVIASAAPNPPTHSLTRPSKLGWGMGTAQPTANFTVRSLQSAQPLLAYSFPFSTPVYPLFPPQALPQVHNSIFGYTRLLHPFHHSLLQGPQKLAGSLKQGPLGKQASADTGLRDRAHDGGDRKHQGTADKVFHCLYCHREFLDTRGLQRHPVPSSGNVTSLPPASPAPASVPLEPLYCPFCGRSQGSCSNPLPPQDRRWGHLCRDCGRAFASSTALRRHQRQHTAGEVSLGCDYCERCFRDESSLRSHRRIHSGEKPFQCQRCPKRFSLKHQLDTHYRVHTGEKPFECRLCGQRSRDYSAMIKHLRTHGGATPYQCTICLEYCSSLAAMQKHLKSHPVQDFPPDWNIGSTYLYTCHS